MMKCSKECIPICDTCVFCIRNEDTTPVGCILYPEKFGETGYCDDFCCSLALARWEINKDLYKDLDRGITETTARLLICLMIAATRQGLQEPSVTLPLKEYMAMRGLSDEKEVRNQIKNDIELLRRMEYSTKNRGNYAWETISVFGGGAGQLKNGNIVFDFSTRFFDSYFNMDVGTDIVKYCPVCGRKLEVDGR